ncbi:putative prophage protein [Fructobacillus fructosus]|uniref:DUF6978 family protein n=1 Tax=Fructobacillus fructosus TaxID=1631 RepID=UPI0002196062|nr:hypothetical protein [Fructobacillus fructosus]KRN52361.1 hypothetical protein IV71_GL001410 [Fructobacillus fructosus KCTC 3544]GAP01445.1 putative prophage protein [Fructobacillus fructosus]
MSNKTIQQMIDDLKKLITDKPNLLELPEHGNKLYYNAKSSSEKYFVDFARNGHRVKKLTLQLRSGSDKSQVLLRLDVIGPEHHNPRGNYQYSDTIIETPHIHIASYSLYGIKVALPIDAPESGLRLTKYDVICVQNIVYDFLERINIANRNQLSICDPEETSLDI